jgi:Flp pilus assembly protein TadG
MRSAPAHLTNGRRRRARGQSLVEFALVFPIFVTMLMGFIEFGMLFNATLAINYSSRDGALAAAEAGNALGSDCIILKMVDAAVTAPTDDSRITQVEIYKATPNGAVIGSPTTYLRTGTANTTICASVDGSSLFYTQSANGYPETGRCNILAGCGGGSTTVDNVAIRVYYTHQWVTPLRNFVGGGGGGISFDRSSVMRMEPVL